MLDVIVSIVEVIAYGAMVYVLLRDRRKRKLKKYPKTEGILEN